MNLYEPAGYGRHHRGVRVPLRRSGAVPGRHRPSAHRIPFPVLAQQLGVA